MPAFHYVLTGHEVVLPHFQFSTLILPGIALFGVVSGLLARSFIPPYAMYLFPHGLSMAGLAMTDLCPGYAFIRVVYLKMLALVFMFAFVSIDSQITALCGSRGILPVAERLLKIKKTLKVWRKCLWIQPTLMWLPALWPQVFDGDKFLLRLSRLGMLFSSMLLVGYGPPVLWFLLVTMAYLSITVAAHDFMSFQCDMLLVEAGFLAITLAPVENHMRIDSWEEMLPPSRMAIWAHCVLVARIAWSSLFIRSLIFGWNGFNIKTQSFTQNIPSFVSFWTYQCPSWFLQLCTYIFILLECLGGFGLLSVPWDSCRHIGCIALIISYLFIWLWGNFGFYYLLMVTLCVPLLSDEFILGKKWTKEWEVKDIERMYTVFFVLRLAFSLPWFLLQLTAFVRALRFTNVNIPSWIARWFMLIQPLRIVNCYGVLTTTAPARQVVLIQGSNDNGLTWRTYTFKHAPGPLDKVPSWLPLHLPRLDWRMWFLAPRDQGYTVPTWFANMLNRILAGEPAVLKLLGPNPFEGAPRPRIIRAVWYYYKFQSLTKPSDPAYRNYWRRTGPPEGIEFRRQYLREPSIVSSRSWSDSTNL